MLLDRRHFIALAGGTIAVCLSTGALAQATSWPERTVRVIVPFAAGCAADAIARPCNEQLSKAFGQQFVVENRGGASGVIGVEAAAKAAPDGNTLIMMAPGPLTSLPHLKKVPYDPMKSLVPIGRTGDVTSGFVIDPSLGIKTMAELIDYAKKNPGKLSFASSGIGTLIHLRLEALKLKAGIDILDVPYRGGADSLNDVLPGNVHMMNEPVTLPHVKAGKRGMPREKVLATVVSLLDKTLIRVGNDGYAKENGSYGLTTLRSRHLEVAGSEMRFHFKGKSGKTWRLSVRDRRIARMVRSIQDLPGQISSSTSMTRARCARSTPPVNDYLREIAGADVSAKDFRTWAGTVLAVLALSALEAFTTQTQAKMNVRRAIEAVAGQARQYADHLPQVLHSSRDRGLLHGRRAAAVVDRGGQYGKRRTAARRSRRAEASQAQARPATPAAPETCAGRAAAACRLSRSACSGAGCETGDRPQPRTNLYLSVIASPLKSAFASKPTCLPLNSRMAPFWFLSTMARAPRPTASPTPAAP